ncbi:MAG: hypothetical protein U0Q16_04695 [Bryobacteraceae bacterium]
MNEYTKVGLFDLDSPRFDDISQTNGTRYWYARDLMSALGYDNWGAFKKAINRAIAACISANMPVADNFIQDRRLVGEKTVDDYKLTRCACLFVAMNGDPKKPMVAKAQAYFTALALAVQEIPIDSESLDRSVIREEISEREVSLSATAAEAGVEFFGRFKSAGYRGMYNIDYSALKKLKGMPDLRRSLLDFMGRDELAANLFRLTLTEGRIHRDHVRGQAALEDVAERVGRRVRQAMIDETGKRPEDLPISTDIRQVQKGIRSTAKGLQQVH